MSQALEAFFLVASDAVVGVGAAEPIETDEFADGLEPLSGFQHEADWLVPDACGPRIV